MKLQTKGLVLGIITAATLSSTAMAKDWEGDTKDAWIDGKLEGSYLLNGELNNFKIGTDVENGHVTLTGTVRSETHKQLAEEIAKNLDGVAGVTNNLSVADNGGDQYDDKDRSFSSRFYDLTTTAGLKSNYAMNSELSATKINIDTVDGVVTLEGEVDSQAAAQLAEEIASGYDRVSRVQNNLRVSTQN
jgi:hyperosmotically inducible protein